MNLAELYKEYLAVGYSRAQPTLGSPNRVPFDSVFNPILQILRKYPTGDAHLFIPGVGRISNFAAGNFSDTAGTAGAVINQSVARVNDAAGGSSATQSVAASAPTLRIAGSTYSWDFDGVADHLRLPAPLFQMSDDHCVIAGVRPASTAVSGTVLDHRNSASTLPIICKLALNSGMATAQWRDDSGAYLAAPNAGAYTAEETFVFSARKVGHAKLARKNCVSASGADGTVLGATTVNSVTIGATSHTSITQFHAGNIYPIITIRGTVSDADLRVLERWVGSRSGVVLP